MWHNIRSREVAPTWAWTMGASSAIRPSDSNSEATLLISLRRDSLALRSWKERKNSVIHCLFKFKYIHKKKKVFIWLLQFYVTQLLIICVFRTLLWRIFLPTFLYSVASVRRNLLLHNSVNIQSKHFSGLSSEFWLGLATPLCFFLCFL